MDYRLARSDKAWKALFRQAGLRLIQEKVQDGLPPGLFIVKMCAMFCQFASYSFFFEPSLGTPSDRGLLPVGAMTVYRVPYN